jgi:20S proteasome subunit alpha 6
VYENEDIDALLRSWRRSRGEPEDGPDAEETKDESAAATAPAAEAEPAQPPASEDVEMQ